jgi:hypothetical protein
VDECARHVVRGDLGARLAELYNVRALSGVILAPEADAVGAG